MATSSSQLDLEQLSKQAAASASLLAAKHAQLTEEAERLNRCIELFEEWVLSLPGRIEAVLSLPDPSPSGSQSAPEYELCVKFRRDGKKWRLFTAFICGIDDYDTEYKPLRESSLDVKLYVIPRLPLLITEMARQQERLCASARDVANGFEEFARRVGLRLEGK